MSRYALVGPTTDELLTYGGRVIVHDSRDEMQWVFPTGRIVRVSDGDLGRPVLPLPQHPDLVRLGVRWPLQREEWM